MNFSQINSQTGDHLVFTKETLVEFLFQHLESYGDEKKAIMSCLQYVMQPEKGGNIMVGHIGDEILGIVVMNQTGMKDYIPENILVYIAVNNQKRGQGLGKKIMEFALQNTLGNVALHVEPNNPAIRLYEKLGFTNKYLEMRLQK
jgi:ribosomal protein S18 acetylase RimI-like enzyme